MSAKKATQIPLRFNKDIEPVFEIDHMECSYVEDQVVLKANNVVIPRDYVTILLGPSGAGKSTLLESLGLMSQTIKKETSHIKFFPFPGQPNGYPFEQLWEDKNKLNFIRQHYFSFIFQQTNLMSNFNAIENVTLTGLIQSQPLPFATYKAINTTVEELGIKSMEYDKLPSAFSGGERQRIAFSRAAIPDFSVLFGDEPTGNLDHFNSNKLMEFIREKIRDRKNDKSRSALIVSHNIDLALDFADRIIILTKNFENDDSISIILDEFILDKEVIKWDDNPSVKNSLKKEIELLLNNDTTHFVELLSTVKKFGCTEDTYQELKNVIIEFSIAEEENNGITEEQVKFFWDKITELTFKEIQVDSEEEVKIKKLIKQFFKPDKVDNEEIIKNIIGQISKHDKNLAEEVSTLISNHGIYTPKPKPKEGLFLKILWPVRAIFWLLLKVVPLINKLFEAIENGIRTLLGFDSKENNNKIVEVSTKKSWWRPNKWATSGFVAICLGVEALFSKFEARKSKTIQHQFDHTGMERLLDTIEFDPEEVKFTPKPFKKLFYRRESEKLLGVKNKNFWLILLILFLTFMAIGFSSGSLEYLEMKMQDPFIRSVTAELKGSSREMNKAQKLIDTINMSPVLKERYLIDTIVGYNKRTLWLRGDQANSPKYGLDGRTVAINDPLLNIITDVEKNEAVGQPLIDDQDYSIIITREALGKLGCSDNPTFVFKEVQSKDSIKFLVPIPIAAIVKSLPGVKTDYIMSPAFYKNLQFLGDKFLFKYDAGTFYSLIAMDSVYLPEFKNLVNQFFQTKPNGLTINSEPSLEKLPYSYKTIYRMIVAFENFSELTPKDFKLLFDKLKSDKSITDFMKKAEIKETDFVQSYSPEFYSDREYSETDYAFNFNDLQEVESFAGFIREKADIKLEMSNVERMKNYNFVTKLTMLISALLIFFSVLMITLFLSNILRTHLNSIKMNIGTFKAFGIDIGYIYERMMFMYIIVPLLVALGFCSAIGYSGALYYLMEFLTIFDIEKDKYFNLINFWTLGSIIVLLVVNYYTFSKIIRNIFSQTPGHLIYDRANKA